MKLYHGAHTEYTLHIGQCYTDDKECALAYGSHLGKIELDLDDLTIAHVAGYDRDEDFAYGDDGENPEGCDVAVYDDEDIYGNGFKTYRLMTQAAIDAATIR